MLRKDPLKNKKFKEFCKNLKDLSIKVILMKSIEIIKLNLFIIKNMVKSKIF